MRRISVGPRPNVHLKGGPYGGQHLKLTGSRTLNITVNGQSGHYINGVWHETCTCVVCS